MPSCLSSVNFSLKMLISKKCHVNFFVCFVMKLPYVLMYCKHMDMVELS